MDVGMEMILVPVACGAAAVAQGLFRPQSGMFGPVVSRGDGSAGRIALTFDDGPWPGSTDRILDTLAANGAKATFFIIGRYARAHPELVRRIALEGHQIGNHTYDHDRAGLLRLWTYWVDQLRRTDEAIAEIVGQPPRLFRPPMGFKSPPVSRAARRLGHTVVAWSRRAGDGVPTTGENIVRALARTRAGDIVLLHDGRDPASRRDATVTAASLPRVLENLSRSGLIFGTLDELLTLPQSPLPQAPAPPPPRPAAGPTPASSR